MLLSGRMHRTDQVSVCLDGTHKAIAPALKLQHCPLQDTAAAQINASVLTAGDYTVYVKGLSQDVTNGDLASFASHYGEVGTLIAVAVHDPTSTCCKVPWQNALASGQKACFAEGSAELCCAFLAIVSSSPA